MRRRGAGRDPRRRTAAPAAPASGAALLLTLTAAALAGCSAAPRDEAQAVLEQVLESHRASLTAARDSGRDEGGRGSAPAGSPAGPPAAEGVSAVEGAGRGGAEGLRPVALRPRPAPVPGGAASAAALLHHGPEAVLRALGPPALRRREGSAEIWLYEGTACRLDLVLYAQPGGGAAVAWAAARAAGTERVTEAACLASIARHGPGI